MKKILIMESNRIISEDISLNLLSEGLIVFIAKNYQEGLKLIEEVYPDLIICNIDLLEDQHNILKCSELEINCDIEETPIIFISFNENIILIKSAYISWYVFEPLNLDSLISYINIVFKLATNKNNALSSR